jgi:molybdenum cofactor cytidylyltransferase
MSSRPMVVVLAAGRGSRFAGTSHKLEQSLGGGSVLSTTLRQVILSQLQLVVVTTEALAPMARCHVAARDIVVLPEVGSDGGVGLGLGMGRSIAAGVGARPEAPGWLVLPADMPMIKPSTLIAVGHALAQHPVAYAQHAGRRGHPVGFSGELYSELVMLSGDEGARRLVARYPSFGVDVDDPGTLIDLDTVDDLKALRAVHGGVRGGVPAPG